MASFLTNAMQWCICTLHQRVGENDPQWVVVVERVSDASDQLEGVGDGVKARVEDVD